MAEPDGESVRRKPGQQPAEQVSQAAVSRTRRRFAIFSFDTSSVSACQFFYLCAKLNVSLRGFPAGADPGGRTETSCRVCTQL